MQHGVFGYGGSNGVTAILIRNVTGTTRNYNRDKRQQVLHFPNENKSRVFWLTMSSFSESKLRNNSILHHHLGCLNSKCYSLTTAEFAMFKNRFRCATVIQFWLISITETNIRILVECPALEIIPHRSSLVRGCCAVSMPVFGDGHSRGR